MRTAKRRTQYGHSLTVSAPNFCLVLHLRMWLKQQNDAPWLYGLDLPELKNFLSRGLMFRNYCQPLCNLPMGYWLKISYLKTHSRLDSGRYCGGIFHHLGVLQRMPAVQGSWFGEKSHKHTYRVIHLEVAMYIYDAEEQRKMVHGTQVVFLMPKSIISIICGFM